MRRFVNSTVASVAAAVAGGGAMRRDPSSATSSSLLSPTSPLASTTPMMVSSFLAASAPLQHPQLCQSRRSQSSLSPTAINNVKGTPAVTFTSYKVYHVICKHDPKLRGRQGPQLMAIVYNRYHRLLGTELAPYKRVAAKLNRLRSLASQRLLLSSVVLKKFGVENYRSIYPNSNVTMKDAQRVLAASNGNSSSGSASSASSSTSKKQPAKKSTVVGKKVVKKLAAKAKSRGGTSKKGSRNKK